MVERFWLLPLRHKSSIHCACRTACEGGCVVRLDHFLITLLAKHRGLNSSISVSCCTIMVTEAVNFVMGISGLERMGTS